MTGLAMRSKAIAVYDFRLGKWLYFDGTQFRLLELEPGQLMLLNRQPSWVTLSR